MTNDRDEYFYNAQEDLLICYAQPTITAVVRGGVHRCFTAIGQYRLVSVHGEQDDVTETYTGRAVDDRESVGLRYREKVVCGAVAITEAQAHAHYRRWGIGAA